MPQASLFDVEDEKVETPKDPLVEQEADDLERVITVLDTQYEAGDPCVHPDTNKVVPDTVYDGMRKRLREIRPASVIFSTVTASEMESSGRKVKHDPPMTSIHKANGSLAEKDEVRLDWLSDIWAELGYMGDPALDKDCSKHIVQTWKVDGVACSLVYKKGKLFKAGLRPRDGVSGEDITENAKYVEGVPEELPLKIDVVIRGELYCPKNTFEKVNKELLASGEIKKPYANPRNYTTGSVRQFKDPTITKKRQISFRAYSALGVKDPPFKTEIERAKWIGKTLGIPTIRVEPHVYDDLKKMEAQAPSLDYEVDGVVLSVNDLEGQQQMGTHGGSPDADPRGKLAWKFEEEHADCKVKEIKWFTGRTRKVTPVANFEGVQLAGTTVVNCTLHSLGNMRRKQIGLGTMIRVIKSGKIIPFVQETVSGHKKDPEYPTACPSCGKATHVEDNGLKWTDEDYTAELVCTNPACGATAVSTLIHFLVTLGIKGLGESTVETLYTKKVVETWADFYEADMAALLAAGFSPREATLMLVRLRMYDQPEQEKDDDKLLKWYVKNHVEKIKVPLWQLFASLGIPGAGKTAGRELEKKYKSLAEIMDAKVADLEAIENFGTITAEAVVDFFKDNRKEVERLLEYFEVELPKTGKLTGQTFVFSGGFEGGKETWEKKVQALGGTIGGSVSKKTTYLVAGPGSGSKSDKAKQLGVTILDIDGLKKLL